MGCLSEELVLARVGGQLPPAGRAEVDAHLDDCAACRQLVAAVADAAIPSAAPLDGDATELDRHGEVTADPMLAAGTLVGSYRVEHPLGGGAMGMVYAGRHETLGRSVALKVARTEDGKLGPQLRARLLREARAASAVTHRHVVTVHDVLTTDDGRPVIVMDRLEGRTLRQRLAAEGRLSPREAATLMDQVLSALQAAHAAGVIHRDLKPDNIFLVAGEDGEEVRLVDFGIAKLTAVSGPTAQSAGLTVTGMLVGTPHYMAPEQAFAEPVDARTDLWAVGVVLYECLSGRRPIAGNQVGQILRRLARYELVPLEQVAPHVPRPLVDVVASLLREREARPPSAAATRKALGAASLLSDAAQSAPPRSSTDAALARADTLDAHEAVERPHARWAPWMVIAAATILAGGLLLPQLQRPGQPLAPAFAGALPPAPSEPAAPPSPGTQPGTEPSNQPAASSTRASAPTPLPSPAPTAGPRALPPAASPRPSVHPAPSATAGPGNLIVEPPF